MPTHTVQTLLGPGRWGAVLLPEAEQGCLAPTSFPPPAPRHLTPLGVGPPSNIQKDISGVFFLYSHFLRINGLIDADSLKNKREGGGEGG